eukprot:m.312021 g.312021  ORF g.312021 m.312021 type:complete len:184 (-) comp28936_c0_seq1:183-734(-)
MTQIPLTVQAPLDELRRLAAESGVGAVKTVSASELWALLDHPATRAHFKIEIVLVDWLPLECNETNLHFLERQGLHRFAITRDAEGCLLSVAVISYSPRMSGLHLLCTIHSANNMGCFFAHVADVLQFAKPETTILTTFSDDCEAGLDARDKFQTLFPEAVASPQYSPYFNTTKMVLLHKDLP